MGPAGPGECRHDPQIRVRACVLICLYAYLLVRLYAYCLFACVLICLLLICLYTTFATPLLCDCVSLCLCCDREGYDDLLVLSLPIRASPLKEARMSDRFI